MNALLVTGATGSGKSTTLAGLIERYDVVADGTRAAIEGFDDMGAPDRLRQMCEWVGWDRLCFSSDYPHWDFDDPRFAFTFRLSEPERLQVFNQNARAAYNLV